jgi:hypothetical protein
MMAALLHISPTDFQARPLSGQKHLLLRTFLFFTHDFFSINSENHAGNATFNWYGLLSRVTYT